MEVEGEDGFWKQGEELFEESGNGVWLWVFTKIESGLRFPLHSLSHLQHLSCRTRDSENAFCVDTVLSKVSGQLHDDSRYLLGFVERKLIQRYRKERLLPSATQEHRYQRGPLLLLALLFFLVSLSNDVSFLQCLSRGSLVSR